MQERQAFMERAYANWDRAGNDVGELCRMLESA